GPTTKQRLDPHRKMAALDHSDLLDTSKGNGQGSVVSNISKSATFIRTSTSSFFFLYFISVSALHKSQAQLL
ncbi:hypothetical protein BgiBS90_013930, partial [Biomphalaria glabrata]